MKKIIFLISLGVLFQNCTDSKIESKGFQVSQIEEDDDGNPIVGLELDSIKLETRPRNVLLTKHSAHKLIPIYKVNYDKKSGKSFTGSNYFHTNWESDDDNDGNNWNNNFMPGIEAIYGYNFVNVAHFNQNVNTRNELFKKPVLIKTLYYPAFSQDTLNGEPIERNFYMISVYDEDTNKDGFINIKDLRRLYLFDLDGIMLKPLVPKNHSVMSSEYDAASDLMYVFTKLDQNKNGQMEQEESSHIFWIDLKNPESSGVLYSPM